MADIKVLLNYFPDLLMGAKLTLWLSLLGIILSLVWGILVYYIREFKFTRHLGEFYFEFMRNTPLLVQMLFIYFGLSYFNIQISAFSSALIAITLQHGAFISDLYRAGINNVPSGHYQAASALGMTNFQSMRFIVFPQALIKIIPPLSNQLTLIIKDTSLAAGISVMELTMMGRIVSERTANSFIIFGGVALIYIIINISISIVMRQFERKLD